MNFVVRNSAHTKKLTDKFCLFFTDHFYPSAIKAVGYSDHQRRAVWRAGGRAGGRSGGRSGSQAGGRSEIQLLQKS